MEQHPTEQESKTPKLFGKSHTEWLQILTGDNRETPGNRYGRTAAECAPWAVAGLYAWEAAGGVMEDDPADLAEHFMSKAVNNHDGVYELVMMHRGSVPQELLERLEISHE